MAGWDRILGGIGILVAGPFLRAILSHSFPSVFYRLMAEDELKENFERNHFNFERKAFNYERKAFNYERNFVNFARKFPFKNNIFKNSQKSFQLL